MIQGAINQLIGIAAAAKKAHDVTAAKMEKAKSREQIAKEKAIKRTQDKINAKYTQNKEYQAFVKSLGNNQAPDLLKQIAFDASKRAPEVRIGGSKVDYFSLSPEARAAIDKGGKR